MSRNSSRGLCSPSASSTHYGLPPCRGGGAYVPMTQMIFNLKEKS